MLLYARWGPLNAASHYSFNFENSGRDFVSLGIHRWHHIGYFAAFIYTHRHVSRICNNLDLVWPIACHSKPMVARYWL